MLVTVSRVMHVIRMGRAPTRLHQLLRQEHDYYLLGQHSSTLTFSCNWKQTAGVLGRLEDRGTQGWRVEALSVLPRTSPSLSLNGLLRVHHPCSAQQRGSVPQGSQCSLGLRVYKPPKL